MAKPVGPPLVMEAWLAFLGAHARAIPRVSDALEAACGISLGWFDVLQQLALAPGERRRMHELADAVLLSRSGLTRLVDRMDEAGLVTRSSVPGDRRSLFVQLTEEGSRLVKRARPIVRGLVADLFGRHLTPAELQTLKEALGRVARAASE